jgi:hypothetical protein
MKDKIGDLATNNPIFHQNTTIPNNSYTLHVNMDLLNVDNIITCFGSSSHHQVIIHWNRCVLTEDRRNI